MNALAGFSPITRALIVSAAIAIVLAFLQAAASIVAPILLAAFIAVVATPPLRWMQRQGMPKWVVLAAIVLVLLWSWVLGTVGAFLSVPLTMAIIVMLEASTQTRPIAILLGPELVRKTEPDEETSSGGGAADRDPGSP